MGDPLPTLAARKAEVIKRVGISGVIERHVKLSGTSSSANRRGRCPFHEGKSASFAVSPGKHFAHCFGCQWHGNVIQFLEAIRGISFLDALEVLEGEVGLAAARAISGDGPIHRERNPATPPKRASNRPPPVDPLDMGRWCWKQARGDLGAVRRYFTGRGIPAAVLTAARLKDFRFLGDCPVMQWPVGANPRSVPIAPAVIALVRKPEVFEDRRHEGEVGISPVDHQDSRMELVPCGVHVTYLAPDGVATMKRRKPWAKPGDPDPDFPKRRMLGPVGHGAVFLGDYAPCARLFIGEGNETVLSAIALAGADDAVGVAALSLDNLQGHPRKWKGGIWPLHAIEPEAERGPFRIPGHTGPVTGLVDSDMAELRNQKLVERKGGPILTRAISGAERARICGELFVKGWRAAGVAAEAMRAPAGMDFNDVVRAEAA